MNHDRMAGVMAMSTKRNSGNSTSGSRPVSPSGGTRKRRRRSRSKPDPRKFWGNPETLPRAIYDLSAPVVTNAIPASLGRPPITGQETVSIKYFDITSCFIIIKKLILSYSTFLIEH